MNVKDGDRLAAIAILEPSPNGNGEDADTVIAEADGEADQDPALAAVLPTHEEVEGSLVVADGDLEEELDPADDEELIADTDADSAEEPEHS
jgi:hypothetical protein